MHDIPAQTLAAIERHFHDLIRQRVGWLLEGKSIELPRLRATDTLTRKTPGWFPVDGMHGGFRYTIEGSGAGARLLVDDWCRICHGWGMAHEITAGGIRVLGHESDDGHGAFGGGRISDCVTCKHCVPGATCRAFPDGIPPAILDNKHDHRKPYPGDHGIRWEPREPGMKHPSDEECAG